MKFWQGTLGCGEYSYHIQWKPTTHPASIRAMLFQQKRICSSELELLLFMFAYTFRFPLGASADLLNIIPGTRYTDRECHSSPKVQSQNQKVKQAVCEKNRIGWKLEKVNTNTRSSVHPPLPPLIPFHFTNTTPFFLAGLVRVKASHIKLIIFEVNIN